MNWRAHQSPAFTDRAAEKGGEEPHNPHALTTDGLGKRPPRPFPQGEAHGAASTAPWERCSLQGLPGDGGRSHAARSSCGWTKCRLAKSTVLIWSWLQFRSSFFPGKRKEAQWAAAAGNLFSQGRPSSVSRVHRGCLWQRDYLFDDLFHKGAAGWVAVDGAQLYKESTGNIIKFS